MNFTESQRKYSELRVQLQNNQISCDQFIAAVGQLKVQDPSGTWWQPNPSGIGWIYWNGTSWQSATSRDVASAGLSSDSASRMDIKTFREISKTIPLGQRPQKWWDLFSILGGIVTAMIWFMYSSISGENFDILTPGLMIAIPFILVRFRGQIDTILLPAQSTRNKIPRMFRIGIGIVIPFLTAWILFNIIGLQNYPYMNWNLIFGTLISYIIVRDPIISLDTKQRPGAFIILTLWIPAVLMMMTLISPAFADDCLRDPTRAEDCLRTPGFAEILAGIFGTIMSILVNGPIIIQGILGGGGTAVSGPSAPPSPSSEIIPSSTPTGTGDAKVQAWIDSRTVYHGDWQVSEDKTYVYIKDLPGYKIPVDQILGTSADKNQNIIFTTEIPKNDHAITAEKIVKDIEKDGLDADAFRKFTYDQWTKKLDASQKENALKDLALVIAKHLNVGSVTVEFTDDLKLLNGKESYAHYHTMTGEGTDKVVINRTSVCWDNPGKIVEVLAHEIKHKQQWDINNPMENSISRNIATINKENYHNYEEDPTNYAGQYVENDANSLGQQLRDKMRSQVNSAKNIYSDRQKKIELIKNLSSMLKESKDPNASIFSFDRVSRDKEHINEFIKYIKSNENLREKARNIKQEIIKKEADMW